MKPLIEALQTPKKTLKEFSDLTQRVLKHIENVITDHNEIKDYYIYLSFFLLSIASFSSFPLAIR